MYVRDRCGRPLYLGLAASARAAHTSFVLDALEQAIHDLRSTHRGGLVRHSDRASQYA